MGTRMLSAHRDSPGSYRFCVRYQIPMPDSYNGVCDDANAS